MASPQSATPRLHAADARDNSDVSYVGSPAASSSSSSASSTSASLAQTLLISDKATTNDFPFPGPVFEFDSTARINDALHALAKRHVLSAPVFDVKQNKYLGFVDSFDLMMLAVGVDALTQILPPSLLGGNEPSRGGKSPRIAKGAEGARHMTLGDLFTNPDADAEMWTPWHPVYEGESFKKVVELLSNFSRRVPVVNKETGRVTKIISQSAVVSMLYDRLKAANLSLDSPAASGIGLKKVLTIRAEEQARLAFQLMVEHRVSAIAVVDEKGSIFTVLSSKDIRLIPTLEHALLGTRNLLDLTVREFVSMVRRVTDLESDGKSHAPVVSCDVHTSLSTILGKLAATKMHRVFILDENRKPVGVVSVSDVLFSLHQVQPALAASSSSGSKA